MEKDFVKLITENQGLVHKVCFMYAKDEDERKDLFQEIALQLWKAFPGFRGEAKITTWFYRIALNTAISSLRKKKRTYDKVSLSQEHLRLPEPESDYPADEIQQLQKATMQLNDLDRAVVMLVLEEVPYEEIAEVVGISQNNVRVRMNRVKEKLRKILTKQDGIR